MRLSRENKNGTGGRECVGGETSEEMFARFDKAEKEKVYCKNCRHSRKIRKKLYAASISPITIYYCTLAVRGINNLSYNCKFYKRKWWKFWVKGVKYMLGFIDLEVIHEMAVTNVLIKEYEEKQLEKKIEKIVEKKLKERKEKK